MGRLVRSSDAAATVSAGAAGKGSMDQSRYPIPGGGKGPGEKLKGPHHSFRRDCVLMGLDSKKAGTAWSRSFKTRPGIQGQESRSRIKEHSGTGAVVSWVECWHAGFYPQHPINRVQACNSSTCEVEEQRAGAQGPSWLQSEFEASLDYRRPCLSLPTSPAPKL